MKSISRRVLLKETASAAGALALGVSAPELLAEERAHKTKVVIVTCPEVIERDRPVNGGALRKMVEKGITELAGKRDVTAAWKSFIRPTDSVALADAGTWLLNVPEVVVEVMRGVVSAAPSAAKFTYCAYDAQHPDWLAQVRSGLQEGAIPPTVMDGNVYTFRPSKFHQNPFTALVMTPTLKSHTIAGVSGVIKHYATMCKEGPAPHHPNAMETAGSVIVPQFGHMRPLIIVDALRFGETTRGPQFYQKSLIFGTDPVAVDVVALDVYLRNCKTHGDLPPEHHRILADTRYKAGTSDRAKIAVREVKV
jgi:hypothetical protein